MKIGAGVKIGKIKAGAGVRIGRRIGVGAGVRVGRRKLSAGVQARWNHNDKLKTNLIFYYFF